MQSFACLWSDEVGAGWMCLPSPPAPQRTDLDGQVRGLLPATVANANGGPRKHDEDHWKDLRHMVKKFDMDLQSVL
eukprot:12403471-Karenia_brevis.AAC.1